MNPILKVKLNFLNESNTKSGFVRNLRANATTTTEKIDYLIENLRSVVRYYDGIPKIIRNIFVNKSNQFIENIFYSIWLKIHQD